MSSKESTSTFRGLVKISSTVQRPFAGQGEPEGRQKVGTLFPHAHGGGRYGPPDCPETTVDQGEVRTRVLSVRRGHVILFRVSRDRSGTLSASPTPPHPMGFTAVIKHALLAIPGRVLPAPEDEPMCASCYFHAGDFPRTEGRKPLVRLIPAVYARTRGVDALRRSLLDLIPSGVRRPLCPPSSHNSARPGPCSRSARDLPYGQPARAIDREARPCHPARSSRF